MIGRLTGRVLEKQPPYLLLDVNGVGYELQAPMTTFYRLPALGQEVVLHTHLSITENLHQLFGFIEQRDRSLFRTLIKVSGVGPKLAVAILSGMEANDIARCVRDNNVKALTKVPGIGQKTAERLVIDLQQQQTAQEAQQAEVINEQALAHHERGEYAEAAALYQQALALVEKHLGNTDITGGETIAAAHIHSGLADTYAARKLYPEAISAYKRALAIYQARNEAAAAQASALNGLAIIYYMERNFTEAEPLFVQALALLGGEQGEDTQAMLPILDNLVALYTSTGRRAQAQPLRKRAAELRKQ